MGFSEYSDKTRKLCSGITEALSGNLWRSHSQRAGRAPGRGDVKWSITGFRLKVYLLFPHLLEAEPEGKPRDEKEGVTGLTEQSCVFVD